MAATVAVIAAAAVAWLGWCAVLIRREDVASRIRLADAVREAEHTRQTVADLGELVGKVRTDLSGYVTRLDDAERRIQSLTARVGMR